MRINICGRKSWFAQYFNIDNLTLLFEALDRTMYFHIHCIVSTGMHGEGWRKYKSEEEDESQGGRRYEVLFDASIWDSFGRQDLTNR